MSEETQKSAELFAPLLTRAELMELDTESLVEKILGLRGDTDDDAEEMADLRAALERAEASLATTRDIAQRAIAEGRDTAPTDAELAAHEAAGGSWLYRGPGGQLGGRRYSRGPAGEPVGGGLPILVRSVRRSAELGEPLGRWWALDASGNICAWPTVEVSRVG